MWGRRKTREPRAVEHVEIVTTIDNDRIGLRCECPRRRDHERLTSRAFARSALENEPGAYSVAA